MNQRLLFLITSLLLVPALSFGQFGNDDIQYWVGSGTDTSILVISFNDATWDSSYAWGYLHTDSVTGEQMLTDIAEADVNLSVGITGGFLNEIIYHRHAGTNDTAFFWGLYSGTQLDSMSMNNGLSTMVGDGDWFGCSFTDFDPAVPPSAPIAAYDPNALTHDDLHQWVGSGTDTALVVIDFLDGTDTSSFAWGYLFNDTTTGEAILTDLAAADSRLTIDMSGGFLNDIEFNNHAGIGGSPNYWATWSATNYGNWNTNSGIGAKITNGMLFGATYTDFNPAVRAGDPVVVDLATGISKKQEPINWNISPVPAKNVLRVNAEFEQPEVIRVFSLAGKQVVRQQVTNRTTLDISDLSSGVYVIEINGQQRKFVKQ